MSTAQQRQAIRHHRETGKASTQAQEIAAYLLRAQMATTNMVANFMGIPPGRATARLDELASEGRVIKTETPEGRTGWKYITDPELWPVYQHLYDLGKVRRNIGRLIRANEVTPVLPPPLVSWLKREGAGIERLLVDAGQEKPGA